MRGDYRVTWPVLGHPPLAALCPCYSPGGLMSLQVEVHREQILLAGAHLNPSSRYTTLPPDPASSHHPCCYISFRAASVRRHQVAEAWFPEQGVGGCRISPGVKEGARK